MANKPTLMTTTLWDFPSQQYGDENQGDQNYLGATPSYIIWNLLQRYTRPGELVVDPMCGSGTTLDVAHDVNRKGRGFDLQPTRKAIVKCDARTLPLENESADFVFIDPPYSTHLKYSGDPRCIGELSALGNDYYAAMEQVIVEIQRILKPGRHMGLYVSDSYEKNEPFMPIGFELFAILRRYFEPVDVITVVRRNRTMMRAHWHTAALEGNYYLRGFNYLFIMKKAGPSPEIKLQLPGYRKETAKETSKDTATHQRPSSEPAPRKPSSPRHQEKDFSPAKKTTPPRPNKPHANQPPKTEGKFKPRQIWKKK